MAGEPNDETTDEPAAEPPAEEPVEEPSDNDGDDWKKHARTWETRAKAAAKELEDLKSKTQTDAEKAVEKARKEGREEAQAAATAAMVETVLESVADAKLADPTYVRLIDEADRDTFAGPDGKPDRKAITKSVDDLLKKHPELAKAGTKGAPLPGGGKNGNTSGFDMNDEIRRGAGRA